MRGSGANLWFLALVPLAAGLGGCFWFTSRAQGEELLERTDRLTKRVEVLEKQLESDRQEYTALIQKAEQDLAQLETVLETATKTAAGYTIDMENMREQLARIEGELAELRRAMERREDTLRDRVEQIAAKVGLDPPLDPSKVPQDRDKLLAAGDEAAKSRAFGKARSLYRVFLDRFPADEMADNVQLKLGRTYAAEERHAQALTALNVIVDRYPESDVMGETLYSMAESLYKMRSCNDAITLLQAVIQRYSDPGLTKRARSKLREVQRAKRRGCRP